MSKEVKEALSEEVAVPEKETAVSSTKSETKSDESSTSKTSEKKTTADNKKDTESKKVESAKSENTTGKQEDATESTESVVDEKRTTENDSSEIAKSSSVDILPSNSEDEVKFAVRGKDYKLHIYNNRLGTQVKTVAFGAVTAVINKDEPGNKVLVYADPSCSNESVLGWANISDLIAL